MTLATRVVTATLREPDTRTPLAGTVTFTPGGGVLVDPASGRILAGAATVPLDGSGALAVPLVPTDTTGIQPAASTWNWDVSFNLVNAAGAAAPIAPFNFALPTGSGAVDLSTVIQVAPLAGTYLVIPGPQGIQGVQGIQGFPGSGGGTAIGIELNRVAKEIIVLTTAASWTVVATSDGTKLNCSIPAVVGDRIYCVPGFMRTLAGVFLDIAIMKADGVTASVFAGSRTSSSLPEGNDEYYPDEAHFPGVSGGFLFTVTTEMINAGSVSTALMYQGTTDGTQKIYAHPQYPWDMLCFNFLQ